MWHVPHLMKAWVCPWTPQLGLGVSHPLNRRQDLSTSEARLACGFLVWVGATGVCTWRKEEMSTAWSSMAILWQLQWSLSHMISSTDFVSIVIAPRSFDGG
ncbi:hypothetical protein F2Q69_00019445 [Brassica cretica]|uniref:Uncharacterized protein n=1 Tax=Brassica cretica TaxID=69181 RepID=A0A8S9QIX4_BRACR|nr:hypothetical protein F2Q69_00019445 [Brassica cretica]